MAFHQLFHLILHEIDRFACFMLKSGFFSKSLVLCLTGLKKINANEVGGLGVDLIPDFLCKSCCSYAN